MSRLIAFALLGCAAFAWVPPFLDRPGTAALGFAFLALSVGRGLRLPALSIAPPVMPTTRNLPELRDDLSDARRDELAAY